MKFSKQFIDSPLVMIVVTVITTFLVGMFFAKVGGGVPISVTQTTTEKKSTFDVTGEGEAVVVPDEVELNFGVEETADRVEEAQERVNEKMNNLQENLKKLGIDKKDIQTTSYNVYPDYDRDRKVKGYRVSSRVQVKFFDFSKINQVIGKAGELGLNQVGNLRFGLSEEAEEETLSIAREKAVKSAKLKAKELAKLAGVKLGKVVNVDEQQQSDYRPRPMLMMEKAMDGDEQMITQPQIEPGSEKVVVLITLSYTTD
ncbi:MAG: SIMPL domain-containing protein [Patescibacteria group bacterium]|nr:SIMPL domain-containing protein [Patescibacteria group bacterium]